MKQNQKPEFSVDPESINLHDLEQMFSEYPIYIPPGSKTSWKKDDVGELDILTTDQEKAQPVSWAALFDKNNAASQKHNPNIISVDKSKKSPKANGHAKKNNKKRSLKELLKNWNLNPSSKVLIPRGLVNSGNMCFMNVALQALVYCNYFAALLNDIKNAVSFSFDSPLPLVESLIMFMNEFEVLAASTDPSVLADQEPFVPEYVYNALRQKKIFQTTRGQQEDAQEFLGHMLNGIHDELLHVINSESGESSLSSQGYVGFASPKGGSNPESGFSAFSADGDTNQPQQDWLEVGRKNKTSTTREIEYAQTPVTQIFGGYLRSELKIQGLKPSLTKEPYQFLALDISNPHVVNLEDAIDQLLSVEVIEGYTNPSKQPAEASKQLLLDSLPQVFIFILNRVVFSPDLGVHKLNKFISYPETFQVFDRWLSPTAKKTYSKSKYKLTSVLYHHGDSATGGHYTSEIMRQADEWIRFDDTEVSADLTVRAVLSEKDDRSAYILFYSRV